MALKVLLADDSAAIKKVVQLSLQDLGVELKAISSGKDAIEVAKQFKPHIAFVDVLLPQISGYDVALQIKSDSSLAKTPVILLWSAFMAFDESKYRACGADAKLEKPFDSNALREFVAKYVPALKVTPTVEFEMPIGSVPPPKKPVAQPSVSEATKKDWSMSSFEEIPKIVPNEFSGELSQTQKIAPVAAPKPVDLKDQPVPELPSVIRNQSALSTPDPANWNNDNEWVRKDLGKFQVPIPQEAHDDEGLGEAVPFTYTESKIVDTSFLFKPNDTGTSTMLKKQQAGEALNPEPPPFEEPPPPAFVPDSFSKPMMQQQSVDNIAQSLASRLPENLSLEELSDLKLQTREIIEKVVWKLVPELASQMIKEELDRLLAEK